jgi:hypothetical protein
VNVIAEMGGGGGGSNSRLDVNSNVGIVVQQRNMCERYAYIAFK